MGVSEEYLLGGSPPHTRGTRLRLYSVAGGRRITPAYTGNTRPGRLTKLRLGDHPRIHGEHYLLCRVAATAMGSPPHTRGTPGFIRTIPHRLRITPAYTGNTITDFDDIERMTGSPPHTRGTPSRNSCHCRQRRDHPRIHGEHNKEDGTTSEGLGSPPHTRGTLVRHPSLIALSRITPAYTGNTIELLELLQTLRDHPRIHGEHSLNINKVAEVKGSPPHTRGTPNEYPSGTYFLGITPAYTGNTLKDPLYIGISKMTTSHFSLV